MHSLMSALTCVYFVCIVSVVLEVVPFSGTTPGNKSLLGLAEELGRSFDNAGTKQEARFETRPYSQSKNKRERNTKKYLNDWIVNLIGGEDAARNVVEDLGYNFYGAVRGFNDVYHVSAHAHHYHKREASYITHHINTHTQVVWAEQQFSFYREKRGLKAVSIGTHSTEEVKTTNNCSSGTHVSAACRQDNTETLDTSNDLSEGAISAPSKIEEIDPLAIRKLESFGTMFDDELWKSQWYLFDSRNKRDFKKLGINVIPVWESGITGKGIAVLVLDDGLEWTHEDFIGKYNPSISYDLCDDDPDPSPRYDSNDIHGTCCAGEIVMQPNNGKCGVGVAYGAQVGAVRMLNGLLSDRIEGMSLAMGAAKGVDIVTCSWGPADNGKTFEGPGTLAKLALQKGVTEGRDGKGTIFVWASGNGGLYGDNCSCDGYVTSIETIAVSSVTQSGESPFYSERCASTLTAMFSSGADNEQRIVTTSLNNSCTVDFTGTSASTPLAAGIIALALEANPSMTWRDVQHAIVLASDWLPLARTENWTVNGAGLRFSIKFGFGLLKAESLVNLARKWKSVPEKRTCEIKHKLSSNVFLQNLEEEIVYDCNDSNTVTRLEHVQLKITLDYRRRGSLLIFLKSPLGTKTELLTPRKLDDSPDGVQEWTFATVHLWGENPRGKWTLNINDTLKSTETGLLKSLSLTLHGTP